MTDSPARASGQCHCSAIRYSMPTAVEHHALCHCSDCRRHAGAPMVGWALVAEADLELSGTPKIYASSEHGRRHFCGDCGTGLYYINENVLPGLVDIQIATLDDPADFAPQIHVQMADALPWEAQLAGLPAFDRFPG